ncbi:MAG: hypothetical protein WCC04_08345 [Terriglobales bacterium]
MACPYFIPREVVNDGSWPHPSRLPLGAGWSGACSATGQEITPAGTHIREFCNLGCATACPHLPPERDWDAVRFSVAGSSGEQITLRYACELRHAPVTHGTLTYDLSGESWTSTHPDARINRLAASYLHAYRVRRNGVL